MSAINQAVKGEIPIIAFLSGKWRILTNNPRAHEKSALELFRDTKEPIQVQTRTPQGRTISNYLMEIHNGTWIYPALSKLNKRGFTFRLGSISISDLKHEIKLKRTNIDLLVDGSTFAWANATYAFFLYIDGMDREIFSLEAMDMIALDAKKTPKRLQEVGRSCQMYKSGKFDELSCLMLVDPSNEIPEAEHDHGPGNWPAAREEVTLEMSPDGNNCNPYDGPIIVSQSFLREMCYKMEEGHEKRRMIAMIMGNKIDRFIFRLRTPYGLVKGLGLCRPDRVMSHDVIFHSSAIKPEFHSDGNNYLATAFIHENIHTAMWDMQSTFHNHDWLFTEERFVQDSESLVNDITKSFADNKVPDFILHQVKFAHDEAGVHHEEPVVAGWKTAVVRWLEAGNDLSASACFNRLAIGSVEMQMQSARDNNRWWLPMSNAFMATVNTYAALEHMAMMDLPEEKRNCVFYLENVGVVIPTDRFVDTAVLHDTWDQDGDQAKFIWIKIWCSQYGREKLEKLYSDSVLPVNMVVPETPEEAIDVCVVIRSPNGPGGYSIEWFDAETMPWHRRNDERVPVIDLNTAPFGMSTLLETSERGEIPHSVEYTSRMITRDNIKRMIRAQFANPNVGTYANLIMAYSAIMGVSYPEWLPANSNDVIDTNQQEADIDSFIYLKFGMMHMQQLIVNEIIREQIPVDKFVFKTRLSIGMEKQDQEAFEDILVEGKFTRMDNVNKHTLDQVKKMIVEVSFGRRLESETRQLVMDKLSIVKPEHVEWASGLFKEFDVRLKRADAKYHSSMAKAGKLGFNSKYLKMFAETERSRDIGDIQSDLYNRINSHTAPEKWAVLLYRYIVDPSLNSGKYGLSDRIIFQNGQEGQPAVMDLLIQGLTNLR